MAPLTPRSGHGLLRCPICRLDLDAVAGVLACRNRHSFDLARAGYVNLLRGGRRVPASGGDDRQQLRHRAAFLEAGHFDAISATIADLVRRADGEPVDERWRVLDAGSGTAYHLARLAAQLGSPVVGLGLDISRDAVRHAAQSWPEFAFAVTDLWGKWPVHDGVADLVINIFAPRNVAEATRALRPGGWLAMAYPGPDHLLELRRHFRLMGRHEHKAEQYLDEATRLIGPCTIARLTQRKVVDAGTIRDLILMGPNARHVDRTTVDAELEARAVTFDIAVLFVRKPTH